MEATRESPLAEARPWPRPLVPASLDERPRAGARALRAGLRLGRVGIGAFVLYALLFNVSVVRGNSMSPGIHDGDRILVGAWTYLFGPIDRGDVVVLQYPLDPRLDYIKRIVGLPGDEIMIAGGRVWVNGQQLAEPYVEETDPESYCSTHVRPGHFFVLGDNRRRSSDSREFGQVPVENVRGRVDLRLWPPSRAGLVD